ncbi:MAG: bifunctional lysylphosphatidylglycerol flippase/synthetase MprF, partial [Myxococcota bacterium]
MSQFLRRSIRPLLGGGLFLVALLVLDRQLQSHTLAQVTNQLQSIPLSILLGALAFAAASYISLTFYDVLALRYVRQSLPYYKVGLTSFIAYVFSMDLGLTVLGSSAIRYRLYTLWGISAGDIAQIVAFSSFTFFVGVLGVGGPLLFFGALPLPSDLNLPIASTRIIGIILTGLFILLVIVGITRNRPISFRGFELTMPSTRLISLTLLVAAADWLLASSVLWLLLPEATGLTFLTFMAIFLTCEVLGLISTVPAGLGVFEGIAIALLAPYIPASDALAALVAWRIIYFLLPIFAAISTLGVIEALQHRSSFARARELAGQLGPAIVPRTLAAGVLVSGLLLVIAGVAPAAASHLKVLQNVASLPIVAISHPLSVISGLGLILLARGIQQRVDTTYIATLVLLAIGATASLLRGSHVLLASGLAVLFLSLIPCRSFFYRRGSLLPYALPREWLGLILIGLMGAIWFASWTYRGEVYSRDLWSTVGWTSDVSHALRALGLMGVFAIAFVIWRVTRPRPPKTSVASHDEVNRAHSLVTASADSAAHLALLGDKSLLFSSGGDGFLMYGVAGKSWVSMGDPVGPEAARAELAWSRRELSDQFGGWPVFYEVGPENIPLYLDLGLSIHKLGELGRVPLEHFNLEGSSHKSMRQTLRRAERDGCSFEVVPAEQVATLIDPLKRVSDAWLGDKNTREKGFSLGSFQPDYLARAPVAVVRQADKVVAFSNLWVSGEHEEVSPDLMRFNPEESPSGVMDYLFIECMLWAQAQSYRWFCLGMAPLSGLTEHRLAPIWSRMGTLLFRHGEHFYN